MNIILIGGGNIFPPLLKSILQVKDDTSILLIPFATPMHKRESWLERLKSALSHDHIKLINIVNENVSREAMIKQFAQSDVLYFTGGRPEQLLNVLQQKQLMNTLHDYQGQVIGYSAGALAICADCIITKDHQYPETQVIKGLGLVPFSVEVHYKTAIDIELLKLSRERTIYASSDHSTLFFDGFSIQFFGEVATFKNEKKLERNAF
ncbi:hypothetical protein EH196_05180 [Bacillus sp. C1-1]|nr:hypothetical protein EH196_05180 [Bacillus sp. C1-1]